MKTKTLLTLSIIICVCSGYHETAAQSTGATVEEIRAKYRNIKSNVARYDTTMMEMWDESTAGGHATAYYATNDDLKLIQAIWFGETGKRITEYYFDNGKLIFAFDQDFVYNRPIYWGAEKAKETGDNEVFDSKKTTVKEDRFYFENEKLFLWLNDDKKEVDLTLASNISVGSALVAHAMKMRDELRE